jgi:hypothetical protein
MSLRFSGGLGIRAGLVWKGLRHEMSALLVQQGIPASRGTKETHPPELLPSGPVDVPALLPQVRGPVVFDDRQERAPADSVADRRDPRLNGPVPRRPTRPRGATQRVRRRLLTPRVRAAAAWRSTSTRATGGRPSEALAKPAESAINPP